MKRVLLMSCLILMMALTLSAETVLTGTGANSLTVISSTSNETILQYRIASFEKEAVDINGSQWFNIRLPKEGISQDKGFPQLPVFNRSIIIDNTARVKLEVYDIEYQDFKLPVAPSKGVITRNIDPKTVPYTFDPIYMSGDFYPKAMVELSEPYIMRDFRGITIKTTPFAYNPATQTLRVFTAYKTRVYNDGLDTVNTLDSNRGSISRDFSPIYENHFVNWNSYRYTPVSDSFGKMLVICHTNYMSAVLPYVNWKKQKGVETELVQWSTIGTTAAQLQTYIQNRYNADHTIAYVQLVGDAPQIPSLSSGGGGSDPSFSLVAGSDNYPDIFIGRFSAETTAQVTTQINKAIVYERDATTSDTWLSRALGIASAEGGGSQGDNGESDIQHMNNIRTQLLSYGYTSVDQVYDPGASAATVTANVNAGRGFMNYVGHGSNTSWSTTGFNNTNATNLTNGNKTPFIMDVACVNGNFVNQTCFAEAWLRNANGGAVAMYASTINQSWNSPMLAEDEATILLTAETKYTTGGLYYNGSCKMMDTYGNTAGSDGVNMFKTWHIFGDASLSTRTKTPIAMAVTHPSNIVSGSSSVNVSTGVNNSLVALTYNDTIYGRGFTNSSGNATITLTSPPTGVVNYTITASAHNCVTYVGTIAQTVASGPWMEVTAANFDDANNDLPEYNESGYFDVTFKNSGTSVASNVTATLSCTTPGITITDASHTISSLAAGASTVADNAYAITIANNVANGTVAAFTVNMTMTGSGPWTYNFSKTISAPALAFGNMTISDPSGNNNGKLDPGETATISMVLNNTGGAASQAGNGTLGCSASGITIVNGSANFSAISAAGNTSLSFTITAASSMNAGTLAAFVFNAAAGVYSANSTINVEVGAPMEITIGSGTTTQTYPIDRYYAYSGHEAIYLASEIGTPGSIKSLGFYKASGTDVNTIEAVTVYMKNTTATSLATGNYSTTGYTQVYSGNWPNNSINGWMEVDLNNQFVYNGSNLSILTIKGNQTWSSTYPMWTYTTASSNRARQNHDDYSAPTSLSATTYLPNLKLKLFPAAGMLYPPLNLTTEATHGSVTLTWQTPFSGTPTGYKVYKNNTALTTVTALTYKDTAVTDGTTYSYKVSALYGSDESDPTAIVTATPNMNPPTNLVAIGGSNLVQLTWTAATGREAEDTFVLGSKDRAISSYKIYKNGAALTTVNGTTYSDAAVTNGTTYNYHVTTLYTNPAGESAASNTATATPNVISEVVIGTGTSVTDNNTAAPINAYYKSMHGQSVYTKAELNAAGMVGVVNITQFGFYVNTAPAYALPSFIVRMKHVSDSNVANWQTSAGMQTVYSNAAYMPAASGYQMLTLNTPFLWNGVDNIVIDTAFSPLSSYSASGTVQYTNLTSGYRFVRVDGADQTNVFTGGQTSSNRPNVKLVFVPGSQEYSTIAVNPGSISETVSSGNSVSRQITISNAGTEDLTWSIPEPNLSGRNITGSSFSCNADTYVSGGTATWTFTVNNASSDAEWIKDIQIAFPAAVTVTSVSSFDGGGNALVASPQSGAGVTIYWHYESSNGYGGIQGAQTASATVNVVISAAASGNLSLPWIVTGDDYGSAPHLFTGTHILNVAGDPQPDDWFSISSYSGSVAPGTNTIITIMLDSEGLSDGTYSSSFTINSNAMFNSSLNIPVSLTVVTPVNPYPVGPRFVAEWEPAQGAVVRYPFGQPYGLLRDLSNEALLYVIVSTSNQSTANSSLQSNNVNMANVRYVNAASDSYWVRDYAPWTILDANHNMHLVDFHYNRPRPNDNLIPSVLASYLSTNLYDLDMNHTGGNMMTDGMGKAMSTTLVLSENNSLSQVQIDQRFRDILGVTDYSMYADPLSTSSIDHIDCHAKLLDVDKVMIARVPSGHTNYTALEATVATWQSKTSSYGTPYQIFRVNQSSNNEPYANSFIFNKKIFVPQWNSTPSNYDTDAIVAYQAAMPGYIVQGYYDSSWIPDDAVHCRVNTIFDNQMIHVRHVPTSTATANSIIIVNAEITHSNALSPSTTNVAYRYGTTGQWQTVALSFVSGKTWTASVPTPALGQTVYYYILATDTTTRSTKLPLCGASDPFKVLVNIPGANTAPTIALPVSFTFPEDGSLVVDFSQYVEDVDGDALTLSYSGNTNVIVSINALSVTFTATSDWHGTENLTFTVSDAALSASDDVDVIVTLSWIGIPNVSVLYIDAATDHVKLQWTEIPDAGYYQIWASEDPQGTFSFLGETTNTYWDDMNLSLAMRFYKVIASSESHLITK